LSAARARKIPVVAVSQASHGGVALGRYAAGSALAQGAVDGGDMTFEAATAKLWWLSARNLDYDEICAEMARNVASERSER
jgi:L-asparaginase